MNRKHSLWALLLLFFLLLLLGLFFNGIFGPYPNEAQRPEGYFSMDPHITPYQGAPK